MLTNIIPAAWRQRVYAAYALIIVLLGATQVGYVTAKVDQPVWLAIAVDVVAYLGVAIGVMAASNITPVPSVPATPPTTTLS